MKLRVASRLSSLFIASCWCTTAALENTRFNVLSITDWLYGFHYILQGWITKLSKGNLFPPAWLCHWRFRIQWAPWPGTPNRCCARLKVGARNPRVLIIIFRLNMTQFIALHFFKKNVEKRQLHATTLGWLSGCRCPWNFNLKLNSTRRICVLHLLVVECTLSIMHASEELRPNWTSGPRFGFPQSWKHMLLVNVDDTCLTNWKTYIIDNTAVLLTCDAGSSWRNNTERLTKLKLETQRIFFQLALR